MKTGTFPKRIFKKKANLILAIVILFVLGAGTFAVSVKCNRNKGEYQQYNRCKRKSGSFRNNRYHRANRNQGG